MNSEEKHIDQAVSVLNDGGIIIFPTDTAFGIGCRIDTTKAVDRLFTIRNRPLTQATPVLISDRSMADSYAIHPSEDAKHFMDTYWPGALTIITECDPDVVYTPVRGGGNTIGLRMPNHETIRAIIRNVGVPLLGPSANFHGLPTPYTFSSLDAQLCAMVDYVVPGICSVGQASTVVDCSQDPYTIVRQGSIILS